MKININNVKKFAAMGLVLVQVTTFTGCRTTLEEYEKPNVSVDNQYERHQTKVIMPEIIETEPIEAIEVPLSTDSVIETPSVPITKKTLLESYDETPIVSTDLNAEINRFYEEHITEINDVLNPEYRDIHIKYGALIYQRLVNAGISKETILGELANVILEQQVPRGVSEEEWISNFGNIVSVLSGEESMYNAYFCLSYLVHDDTCELEHTSNEFGAITCDELQSGFQKKYSIE